MAAIFKTTASGQKVVVGTPAEVRIGQVMVSSGAGRLTPVRVLSLGTPFASGGRQMVYGYLTAAPTQAPAKRPTTPATRSQSRWMVRDESTGTVYRQHRGATQTGRACITDGQCSSHGTGSSCGGRDCDGH